MKIIAQANEHLVSQCMQEESKLIGQESMTTESVHTQVILKGLDEVLGLSLGLCSGHKVIGSRGRPGW